MLNAHLDYDARVLQVVDRIREMLDLTAGIADPLPRTLDLARLLGIREGTVVSALCHLEDEGLVRRVYLRSANGIRALRWVPLQAGIMRPTWSSIVVSIAEAVNSEIINRRWAVLPSLDIMAVQWRTTGGTVRDAMQLLATHGIVALQEDTGRWHVEPPERLTTRALELSVLMDIVRRIHMGEWRWLGADGRKCESRTFPSIAAFADQYQVPVAIVMRGLESLASVGLLVSEPDSHSFRLATPRTDGDRGDPSRLASRMIMATGCGCPDLVAC
jgi:DNA-binding transcriptional regulator YhcF (GntR family)